MLRDSFFLFLTAGLALGPAGAVEAQSGECRAGCPNRVAWYARPSETPAYVGYYVGGGQVVGGACRCPDEGTWGWDYHGWLLRHRTILYWSHGRRYQGGTGAYGTDGPHVPDLPAALKAGAHRIACPSGNGACEK